MRTKIATILALLITAFLMLFSPYALAADCSGCSGQSNLSTTGAIQCGSNCAAGSTQDPGIAANNLNDTTSSLIEVLSIAVAVIAVIMLIIGGLRFVTSSGNQENVASARRSIVYAVVGLVVAALAQLVVYFVLHKTTTVIK